MKLVLAGLAVMVATFVAASGPAMAQDQNCHDAWGNLIRCDGMYYNPYNYNYEYNPYNYGYNPFNNYEYNPYNYNYGYNPYGG
jgi:hypothetical protein